ncbi:phosphotransferase family protein [Brachybacterium alimentarium]|uniref:Serine kinase n=1 Tax=Brachybacterium alimentarium TaxID=47845 RepID=A0A2A3YJ53_9MICO|nr:aminoglycoside phosphotransferase family protein [Brachybacterium alimentarium]PCC39333.1 serine kinase [Brachybacterium alimentarium]RCS89677.1 aminoglycoside phosphotransferase family protein [Brachybacterium alimentarium]
MVRSPSSRYAALLDPASPALGEQLREAWRAGALLRPTGTGQLAPSGPGRDGSESAAATPSGEAQVSLAGVGERFAAWRVVPQRGAAVIVRVPHVAPDELTQDLGQEIAALSLLPASVGPAPVVAHEDPATSPIGHAFVVASDVPGTAAAPEAWTDLELAAHADVLARLHSVPAPGRGPVGLGPDPWAAVPRGAQSLLTEVEEEVAAWRSAHGPVIAEHGLEPFLEAALARVATIEQDLAALDGFVLAHGDLCATNILWEHGAGGPTARYIDFEWAQGDDPARDLAIIGGAVHGGPWYVPLDPDQVTAFVDAYVRARSRAGELPASVADTASLRDRMRAWIAYERTAMLVHVASRASTRSLHRRVLPILRGTLAQELGLPA